MSRTIPKIGDLLSVKPNWNESERYRKLSVPTVVLGVNHEMGCQTGVMIKVESIHGASFWLDLGWFDPTEEK